MNIWHLSSLNQQLAVANSKVARSYFAFVFLRMEIFWSVTNFSHFQNRISDCLSMIHGLKSCGNTVLKYFLSESILGEVWKCLWFKFENTWIFILIKVLFTGGAENRHAPYRKNNQLSKMLSLVDYLSYPIFHLAKPVSLQQE